MTSDSVTGKVSRSQKFSFSMAIPAISWMYLNPFLKFVQFKSVERKNCVIPKYQGFRPVIAADSLLQKTFTEQSRDVFKRGEIDEKEQTMSSTG